MWPFVYVWGMGGDGRRNKNKAQKEMKKHLTLMAPVQRTWQSIERAPDGQTMWAIK